MINDNDTPTGDIGSPPLLARTEGGQIRSFQRNVALILKTEPVFQDVIRLDTFSGNIIKTRPMPWGGRAGEEWTEWDTLKLREYIEARYRWGPAEKMLWDAVKSVAHDNPFHPVQEYLRGLHWDGVHRIDAWLVMHYEVVDNLYTRAVGRKFLIAAVARIMRPGCKVDTALIFEGEQGIGKSTSLKELVPWPELVWDNGIDLYSKDSQQCLQGRWLIELNELEAITKATVPRVKQYLSLPDDNFRAPYGRHFQRYPRQCVFVGTTNEAAYLKDATGGRRFWPVRCQVEKVDLAAIASVRDQLWAEAVQAFDAGEIWYLTREEESYAEEEQAARHVEHPWVGSIKAFLLGKENVTLAEVLTQGLGFSNTQVRSKEGYQVADILVNTFKWKKVKVMRRGVRTSGYTWANGEECAEYEPESPSMRWGRPQSKVKEYVDTSALDPVDDDVLGPVDSSAFDPDEDDI